MNPAEAEQLSSEVGKFTVIGSGVIGLLVARELVADGHLVTVVSAEGKPGIETDSTSAVAVGQFVPWLPESHAEGVMADMDLDEVVQGTRRFYEELAQDPHQTGVMAVENVEPISANSPWPKGLPEAMHASEKKLEKPVSFLEPDGTETPFASAYIFDTFSINTRKTVAYLADRAEEEGVVFERRKLSPEDLDELEGIIVNAGGMGANQFDKGTEVVNYKGHTFIIKPHEGTLLPKQALSVEDLIIMPREDGTVVCGALYIEDPKRPLPEAEEAEALKKRLGHLFRETAELVEDLDPELLEHSEILVHSSGYRVETVNGGVRIAPDEENERLLHAYGFAGIGWSVGPHFAKKIAAQARQLHQKNQGIKIINDKGAPDEV